MPRGGVAQLGQLRKESRKREDLQSQLPVLASQIQQRQTVQLISCANTPETIQLLRQRLQFRRAATGPDVVDSQQGGPLAAFPHSPEVLPVAV
eukprot:612666-Rhodomonas_salina.1